MKFKIVKRFLTGSLKGKELDFITSVDMTESVSKTLGGGWLGPKTILVSCTPIETYYVDNSSIFNSTPYYKKAVISQVLIDAGMKNVHCSQKFGWTNQPEVVCFSGNTQAAIKALRKHALRIHPLINTWGCIILKKDW